MTFQEVLPRGSGPVSSEWGGAAQGEEVPRDQHLPPQRGCKTGQGQETWTESAWGEPSSAQGTLRSSQTG